MSETKNSLPVTDPDEQHFLEDPVQRHIDTQFRLFRHDIFGDLMVNLSGLIRALAQGRAPAPNPDLRARGLRMCYDIDASITALEISRNLEVQFSFSIPSSLHQHWGYVLQDWLDRSERLLSGSLLSFFWDKDGAIQHDFFIITDLFKEGRRSTSVKIDMDIITLTARPVEQNKATVESLIHAKTHQARGVLVEFPKLIPATFVPILENLKNIQRAGYLSFQQYIVPARHKGHTDTQIPHGVPPPPYARRPHFGFSLSSIVKGSGQNMLLDPKSSRDDESLLRQIEKRTCLDRGQCRALVAALTQEFAFIQGPPGTGKSYIGSHILKVLLDAKDKASLGPIIVV